MPTCLNEKRNCHLLLIRLYVSQFAVLSRTASEGQLILETSKYDQMMISFVCKLERSCVQLIKVKSTVFSEPVFCDLFSFTNERLVVINHQHCHDGCKGQVRYYHVKNPWGRVEYVCSHFYANY